MVLKIDARNRIGEHVAMRAMFEARKRVFIDLLKWDIPALDGKFEVDQFDGEHALYIILADPKHRHLASARLLPTTRPGILNSLYLDLCDDSPPSGDRIYEITRFCLSPDLRASDRRLCRDTLVMALARFALEEGITTYTGVAELPWLRQILSFGWDSSLIGTPLTIGKATLGAQPRLRSQAVSQSIISASIIRSRAISRHGARCARSTTDGRPSSSFRPIWRSVKRRPCSSSMARTPSL